MAIQAILGSSSECGSTPSAQQKLFVSKEIGQDDHMLPTHSANKIPSKCRPLKMLQYRCDSGDGYTTRTNYLLMASPSAQPPQRVF